MPLDISSLMSELSWWEIAGYAALGVVTLGVIGESISDFTAWGKSRKEWLGKASALVLIMGLATEGITQSKTNNISGLIIAGLNNQAAQLLKTLSETREQQTQRRLTESQRQALVTALSPFKGQKAFVSCVATDSEACTFAEDFLSVMKEAGWDLSKDPKVVHSIFSGGDVAESGVQITLNQGETEARRIPPATEAFVNTLFALGLIPSKTVFINPGTAAGEIEVRVAARAPLPPLSK